MRARSILGLIAGVILILSGTAHSLLGWRQLRGDLAAARVPSDLALVLEAGWQFGGMAMLAFGIIVATVFQKRLRGLRVASFPVVIIGAAYLVFGAWALVASGFNPFFLLFVVPALLLLAAAPGGPAGPERDSTR